MTRKNMEYITILLSGIVGIIIGIYSPYSIIPTIAIAFTCGVLIGYGINIILPRYINIRES